MWSEMKTQIFQFLLLVSAAADAAGSPMEEEEINPPPVRIIPIPVQPVNSCSPPTHNNTLKVTDV